MRIVVAQCQVDYVGKLTAHLPMAKRLLLVKSDGSVSVHADDRAYKPLNWMSAPCALVVHDPLSVDFAEAIPENLTELWEVSNKDGDRLLISIGEVLHDSNHELGVDPGLQKDGVEALLQQLLAANPEAFGPGWTLVTREHPTPLGPVDLLYRDAAGG